MKKLTANQIVEFIRESNAIEEIHIPIEGYEKGWKNKEHKNPEINGHVKAFQEMLNWKFDKIKPENISKLHMTLMEGLLQPWELGFRREWVRVGSRLCPPPAAVTPMIKSWCGHVNSLTNPTEEDILQTHLAYETIHPFIDGNGRSGRLVWMWLRLKFGFGYKCFFNETKFSDYYPLFDRFLWTEWVKLENE